MSRFSRNQRNSNNRARRALESLGATGGDEIILGMTGGDSGTFVIDPNGDSHRGQKPCDVNSDCETYFCNAIDNVCETCVTGKYFMYLPIILLPKM